MIKTTSTEPNLPIILEDEHLLIINKPANTLSQKDHTGDPDVLSLCKKYLRQKKENHTTPYLGLLHRLDRPVSGLMMMAKQRKAARGLSEQLRDRTLQKTYFAVVNKPVPKNRVLTHYLRKDREKNIVKITSQNDPSAKRALLSFMATESHEHLSLLTIHLQTGRPHQIRVQLAHEGYPVWGDYKYGNNQEDGRNIALLAGELRFNHPTTGKEITLSVPFPGGYPWNCFDGSRIKPG